MTIMLVPKTVCCIDFSVSSVLGQDFNLVTNFYHLISEKETITNNGPPFTGHLETRYAFPELHCSIHDK